MNNSKRPIVIGKSGCMMPLAVAVLAFLLFVSSLYLFPQFKRSLGLGNLPTSFDEMMADEVMGYKTLEIQESILLESRDKTQLVVMEQDIEVDVQISQMLWNIPIFEKTKIIHAFGQGAFGIDLSLIDYQSINVDNNIGTVTITINPASLLYIEQDYNKTQYEDTEHAILAFGEIKMTQEQQTVVSKDINDAMYEALNTKEILAKADKRAIEVVENLFEPLIYEIAPSYTFTIQINNDATL